MNEYIPLWQSINYVGLAGSSLIVCGACILYHLNYRREFAAIVSAVYFAVSTAAYFLLTVATGLHPVIDIEVVRPWIHVCRSLQLLSQLWLIIVLFARVRSGGNR